MKPTASLHTWFAHKGWEPKAFQREAWEAYAAGQNGLVQVATGSGKTYAAYGGPIDEWLADPQDGLAILYLTPLRAMTRDLEKALQAPAEEMGWELRVEARTGDTSSSVRTRQRQKPPHVLLTTPESLSLLLSYADAPKFFGRLRCVIVDEWHELLTSKRGTQTELALARLRAWNPTLRTWALSATLANPHDAAQAAVGVGQSYTLIQAEAERRLNIRTIFPTEIEGMPWAGHFGTQMLPHVLKHLDPAEPAILFANTRSQAELWHEAILKARPDWAPHLAIHHGSLDRDERDRVESGLKSGEIRLVVSTSSLDLGVDFSPVEHIFQLGSPKGVARLRQRGGRARHRPGVAESDLYCVPTHVLQITEFSAAREALKRGELEHTPSLHQPLDVLCQHLVTLGLQGPFEPEALLAELRTTTAYRSLTPEAFQWVLDHLTTGGRTLMAYPEHHRLTRLDDGTYIATAKLARMHRAMIGTITSDGMVTVRFSHGGTIGQVEEGFVAKMRKGDVFLFAGRLLQYVRFRDLVLQVTLAKRRRTYVPHYAGGRMPLSNELSAALRRELDAAARGELQSEELQRLAPIFATQQEMSGLPRAHEILVETCHTREGDHAFIFPFEGRRVHTGLAALLAYRLSQLTPATFTYAANDYGFELLCPSGFPFGEWLQTPDRLLRLLSRRHLLRDTLESINLAELARRQFRTIARVAGLVFEGYPTQRKSLRQLQASSGLIYDVFARFDPANLLLQQAQREVLEEQFEQARLEATLRRLQRSTLLWREVKRPTPFSTPLIADRLTAELSTEDLGARLARLTGRKQEQAAKEGE
ncbi:MAG: ligase-associated DNA damage response DEXH box helicase [Verrucomicrobiota bacterium JB022]|nr:ligase-associated DNA damage response DEXH box helicase [Verrucomicrobiota bacterium JB022]